MTIFFLLFIVCSVSFFSSLSKESNKDKGENAISPFLAVEENFRILYGGKCYWMIKKQKKNYGTFLIIFLPIIRNRTADIYIG